MYYIISQKKLFIAVTFVYVCVLSYGGCNSGGQKYIAVIEKKVLIVSLFANTSDCSNKTCIYRTMCLCKYSLALVDCKHLSLNHKIN